MAASFVSPLEEESRWYFTREQIENSPSRRAGLDPDKELSYRQQAANFIQDMGQRLNLSQLSINTGIVYMHRFYMVQSFTLFHRNVIAPAALFLASKVEEQPRKLEHVIRVAHACLNPQDPTLDSRSDTYVQQSQDLVALESIILQTLAQSRESAISQSITKKAPSFDITIDHPHSHVVKCTQLVRGVKLFPALKSDFRASKDLAQTSYFMATNSLHLTTFCLQYSPTVVACVCIHLACKWSNWEIPVSTDGKHWWEYVDSKVTLELLDELTHEFLQILEKTPNRLKRIRNWKAGGQTDKKPQVQEGSDKAETMMNMISMASSGSTLAGLMSLTAPPSDSSSSRDEQGATWQPAGKDLQQQSNHELQPTARVSLSLSEYRAKHADELAAQKKKLEHMEASVKREYATAAQALLSQQRKEKHHHHQQQQQQQHSSSHHSSSSSSDPNNPSPIVLKIPLDERQGHSSLKMRLHPSSGQSQGHSSRGSGQDIKVRIRVPDRRGGGGSSEEGKSKEKHRERSNHHQHHHHHHHHSSSSGSISSSSSSAHKHSSSGSGSGSSKKAQSSDSMRTSSSSSSSSSSSRKRPHASEPSASSHPSKISKSSRNSYHLPPLNMPLAHSADMLPALGLAHHQESYSHSKGDKADTNGHSVAGGNQSNEYQDTFDMLNSLLSAQGVQPTQPPMFDYHSQYGEYRYGGGTQLPPLPSDPPPQLPPLPK